VDQTVERLTRSRCSVSLAKGTRPRLDLEAAMARSAASSPPSGSLVINGGAAHTSSPQVILTLSATPGVAEVCLTNGSVCAAWRPFAPDVAWTLPPGDGSKRVLAGFRDAGGAESESLASAQIVLDTAAPEDGVVSVARETTRATLRWSDFEDETSGIASYRVVFGSHPLGGCTEGIPIYEGAETSFRHDGLQGAATYHYRVCALDRAGNLSPGVALVALTTYPGGEPL
jgi:hypothetical protein